MRQSYSKMLTKIVLITCTLLLGLTTKAQTTLAAGDIIFTGFNFAPLSGVGDQFSFVTLVQLNNATVISFSDRGYTGSGYQAAGGTEGTITWTSTGTIAAGTEIYIIGLTAYTYNPVGSVSTANGSVFLTEGSSTNGISLANTGESIIAFQGGGGSISGGGTNIAGINTFYTATTTIAGWNVGATFPNPNASLMPPGLTGGTSAFYTGAVTGTISPEGGKFNCINVPTATTAAVRTAVMTVANWGLLQGAVTQPAGCTFISATPVITTHPSNSGICSGNDTTFTVAASNVTGYQWKVSTDGGSIYNNVANTGVYSGATTVTLTITGATAGMNGYKYQCVASNGSGNTTSNAATLTVNSAPAVTGQPSNSSICAGSNTTFSVTASNTTSYLWQVDATGTGTSFGNVSNGGVYSGATTATLNITGATAGMNGYLYRVFASGGCSPSAVSNNASLTVNPAPAITTQPANSSICPGSDTTFTGAASNATNYQWKVSTDGGTIYNNVTNTGVYSGATTVTLTITSATAGMNGYKYQLVATGGCTPTATSNSATLTMSGAPSVTGNPPNRTICTGFNTTFPVTATGATGYQWQVSTDGGGNYNDIANGAPYSGVTTSTLTVTGATSAITGYRYRCTVSSGCGSTNSNGATLTVITIAIAQSQTNVTTYGGSNGTATATPSGGIPTYTYSWSPSGGTAATATGLTAGTYTVTVTDGITCQATSANYVITQPAGVTTSVTTLSAFATCSGTASTNKNFTVNGGGLTADLVVTAPTGYEVSLTSGSGYGGSVSLTQTGGNVATTTIYIRMAASASGTMAGNVTVTSTGVTTKNVTVTGLASNLSASSYIVSNVSCFGGNNGTIDLTPSGGQIPYTYNWGSASTQDRINLTAGTYSVTITDGNSCTYTINNIVVGQPTAALSAATGGGKTDVSCNGGANGTATVAPTGGTPSYTYSWNTTPIQTTATATGLTAGTYIVTVTDANACQTTRSFTINQPTALSAASGGGKTDVSCNGGANGTATVAPTGGTPSYTYSWNTTPIQTTATATGLSTGTYTVTVTDANACQTTRSFTINQPAASLSAATGGGKTDVSCNGGANGTATVAPTGGTPTYTYSWNTSPIQTTATATGLSVGTYTVTVTDNNACQTTRSFTINQPASPLVATYIVSNVLCFGGNTGSIDLTPTGGTPPYSYAWVGGATTQDRAALAAGNYRVTITDANSCTYTTPFITVVQPAAAVSGTTIVTNIACRGASAGIINLTPTGGVGPYTVVWNDGTTTEDRSNLPAGVYTATITDLNGCIGSVSPTVSQPSVVLSATAVVTNAVCNGGNTGAINLTPAGGTPPYYFAWGGGITSEDRTGLTAGTYTVVITDDWGCSITLPFTVTQPSALVASFGSQTNISCNGGTNGSATVSVTGGTGAYTYLWTPSGGTGATASGLSAGTYTVIVKDANLCQTTQSFTVTQPLLLSATTSKTDVLCNGGASGTASVVVSGGTPGYTYIWSPSGGTAATATGLAIGNYSCLVTDANGCQITRNITINQPSVLSATNAQQNATCVTPGQASVTPSGGAGNYTYLWSPSGATTQLVTGLAAGNHSCLITDANGCTITKNFVITTTNTLVATTFQTNLLCNGGNTGSAGVIPSGAPGPYTYVWSPSGGNADTASNLVAGNYSVVITSSNGCSITKNFTITQPSALVATAGTQTNVSCNGGSNASASVTVTGGTGAYTYLWIPSGGTAATASGLAAGTYTVTVKDANLCQTTQSFTITQPNALVASVGTQTNVSCNGGTNGSATVAVTGGTGAYTYLWVPSGGTAATASGLAAGTYTVTVKDANLCQTTQSFTITEPTALTATASQTNILCNGGATGSATVTATGGTGTYTYSWAPSGGTATTATGLVAGTYICTITDANACFITKTFTLTQPSALVASAGAQNNVSCNSGANGTATVNVSGGTTPYTYDWNGTPIGDNTATISGLMAGTYTATITDANGCTTNQIFTITQPAALTATTSQTDVSCFGASNGSASVAVTGGTGAYTYLWAPSGGTAATATGLAAGTYTVTIKDANLCQITKTFTITSTQALSVTPTQNNVSCFGANNGSATVTVTGGTGTYTYVWAPSGGTAATATGLAPGTYTVTATDGNGCTITNTFTITEPAVLAATTSQTNVLCNAGTTGTASVVVSGGTSTYTYLWSPSGGTAATATGLAAGNYSVLITDSKGCTLTKTFTITQPAALTATTTQTNILCFGANTGSAGVTATGGTGTYTYAWSPSGGTAASATGLAAGNYSCIITDANGCSITKTFTITQPAAALAATTTQNNILCFGASTGSATVAAIGGTGTYTYAWTPSGGTAATATGLAAGNYTCTITDANGCTLAKAFTITQLPALVVNGSSTNITCNGTANGVASVSVTGGTPGYTYSWSPSGGAAATATGLTGGVYVCTVTDANGCTKTRSFTIYEQPAITITSVKTDVICPGATTGSATVTVTGGVPNYIYSWSPSGGNAATATGLAAGAYTCTVTDVLGCSVTHNVTIAGPQAWSVGITQTDISCFGNNDGAIALNVSGATGPYTYMWTPVSAGTGSSITNLTVGNYSVTITDALGCTTVRNFSLSQPEVLTASITKTDVSCFGNNDGTALAVITGGTPPYSYSWTAPGGGTPDPANLISGTYTVTITDDNGCTLTENITINEPLQVIVATHPLDVTTTTGGNATYTVNAVNADDYQWQFSEDGTNWSDVTNGGSNPTYSGTTTNSLTITGIPANYNGYSYRVIVKNEVNCTIISNIASLTLENVLEAVNDDFSDNEIPEGMGGIAGDVTANDLFNGLAVNDTDVEITLVDNDGLFGAIIDADGNLIVPTTATPGTYTLTYSICEIAELANCSTAEAIVVVSGVTGRADFRDLKLSIYPNPATSTVFIKIPDFSDHQNLKVSVYDLNGRLVKESRIASELQSMEVTGLESGVYIFKVLSDTAEASRRIVVEKRFD